MFADGVKAESNDLSERAISSYREAARVDGGFAEVHFRLARCYAATGELDEACEHYAQARDCDALQFRADRRINELIRQVASGREAEGIFLADIDRAISQSELAKGRLPGDDLFYDHVHFRFNGDYLVAKTLLPIVETAIGLGWFAAQVPSQEQCAASLAFTTWDEVSTAEPMVQLTARPPFVDQLEHSTRQARVERNFASRANNLSMKDTEEAIASYRRAVSKRTDDWQLRYNFGKLLRKLKHYDQAKRQFENALRLFPDLFPAEISLGDSLLDGGRVDEAIEHYAKAIQIDPHSNAAKRALLRAVEAKSAAANPATHQDLLQN
jgi:tetratricopeptide (TPR) repeat protein